MGLVQTQFGPMCDWLESIRLLGLCKHGFRGDVSSTAARQRSEEQAAVICEVQCAQRSSLVPSLSSRASQTAHVLICLILLPEVAFAPAVRSNELYRRCGYAVAKVVQQLVGLSNIGSKHTPST